METEIHIISFETAEAWRQWLDQNYMNEQGIWLKIYKKASGIMTITYDQALDEALCFGWIDGIKKKFDDHAFIQKFTPRRRKSLWSKRNVGHILRLEAAGKMKPSGQKQVEVAMADGRWYRAYDSPSKMTIPDDFLEALSKDDKAMAFFTQLNKVNTYSITWRLQSASTPEKREKWIKTILEMLARGEQFHH